MLVEPPPNPFRIQKWPSPHKMTTIIALPCKDGWILCADKQISRDITGSFTMKSFGSKISDIDGTLRERVKVQRGWKNPASKIAEGQRIHYNFVKPHQALAGQTPADVAGVGIQGQNKWLALLENAIRRGEAS